MRLERVHGHTLQMQAPSVMLLVTSVCKIIGSGLVRIISCLKSRCLLLSLCGAEKVVGTATPEKDQQDNKVVWHFSTGDVLTVKLGDDLNFHLRNESSGEEVWCHKLLRLCAFCVELDLEWSILAFILTALQ